MFNRVLLLLSTKCMCANPCPVLFQMVKIVLLLFFLLPFTRLLMCLYLLLLYYRYYYNYYYVRLNLYHLFKTNTEGTMLTSAVICWMYTVCVCCCFFPVSFHAANLKKSIILKLTAHHHQSKGNENKDICDCLFVCNGCADVCACADVRMSVSVCVFVFCLYRGGITVFKNTGQATVKSSSLLFKESFLKPYWNFCHTC